MPPPVHSHIVGGLPRFRFVPRPHTCLLLQWSEDVMHSTLVLTTLLRLQISWLGFQRDTTLAGTTPGLSFVVAPCAWRCLAGSCFPSVIPCLTPNHPLTHKPPSHLRHIPLTHIPILGCPRSHIATTRLYNQHPPPGIRQKEYEPDPISPIRLRGWPHSIFLFRY